MIFAIKLGFLEISWVDVLDVVFVTILLYHVYKLMRGTVAVRVLVGFLALYLISQVVTAAGMELLTNILGGFMGFGFLAIIILFQQEIRKFLLMIGKTTTIDRDNIFSVFKKSNATEFGVFITPIIEAMKHLGATNTGALIVLSKSSGLKFYAESGDILNAEISKRLLLSIFGKESPLHDGAVIINDGKLKAARCILPVTENDTIPAHFGLRHRAAVGMSEATDTLVLVVSEETGQISAARNGQLMNNLSAQEIRQKINNYFLEKNQKQEEASSLKTAGEINIDPTEVSPKAG